MVITQWFYNKNIFVRDNFALLDFNVHSIIAEDSDKNEAFILQWKYELKNIDELIVKCVLEDKLMFDQNLNPETIGYYIMKSFIEASQMFNIRKKEAGATFAEITPPNLSIGRSKFIFSQVFDSSSRTH